MTAIRVISLTLADSTQSPNTQAIQALTKSHKVHSATPQAKKAAPVHVEREVRQQDKNVGECLRPDTRTQKD